MQFVMTAFAGLLLRCSLPLILLCPLSLSLFPLPAWSLTVEEAVSLAEAHLPSYAAALSEVRSEEELYKASLGAYLPSLDTTTTQERHDIDGQSFNLSTYDVTLSYTLFDGGQRRANREIARMNRDISREEAYRNLLDLRFNVKSAFYTAIARREIRDERRIQRDNSLKDHEVAQGRHRLGAARLSEVLQASVRLEQARFNLVQSEGDLVNAMSDLNSLLGRPLGSHYDLQGTLDFPTSPIDSGALREAALRRPEIRQSEDQIVISKSNRSLETSAFFPVVSASASYNKTESGGLAESSEDDRSVSLVATWNIFELGKFYRRRAADFDIRVSEENLREVIRGILLAVQKAHEDYLTASRNIQVSDESVRQATQNYEQAFGEYKVGKGDILSLVQAESALANAREQLITSKLNHALAKAFLERSAGVDHIEALAH